MLYSFLERLDEYLKELHEEKKYVTFLENEQSNYYNNEEDK
jgi:hypothetical protein